MKTIITIASACLCFHLSAQTNVDFKTRATVVSDAVLRNFSIDKDEVTGRLKFSLEKRETLERGWGESLEYEIYCSMKPAEKFPSTIALMFTSHTRDWSFLKYHDLTFRCDDKLLEFSTPDYSNEVLQNASVLEFICEHFSLKQFHDLAFAKQVFVKIGYKNYEIPAPARKKWRLLWTFFDLARASKDVPVDFEGEKSAPLPPLTDEEISSNNALRAAESAKKASAAAISSAKDRALKMNQQAADQGDAYGLMRMGERYRDGEGVEKDPAKARAYLEKAVASGSIDAKAALDALPKP